MTRSYGIYPLVRVVACFRRLVYGDSYDREDKNLQILSTEVWRIFKIFCRLIVEEFGEQYINRCPTEAEKERCTSMMCSRGFPGCFASWDCKHFRWATCPTRLAGQHLGEYSNLFFASNNVEYLIICVLFVC